MSYGLNLLPPHEKETVALENTRHVWVSIFTAGIIVLILFIAGTWLLTRQLNLRVEKLAREELTLQQQATGSSTIDLTRDTTKVNTQIELLKTVLGTDRDWSSLVRGILDELPPEVQLTSLKIAMGGGVTLTGTADTRASFLALQSALSKSSLLSNARTSDTPSKREALPFTYTASLKNTP